MIIISIGLAILLFGAVAGSYAVIGRLRTSECERQNLLSENAKLAEYVLQKENLLLPEHVDEKMFLETINGVVVPTPTTPTIRSSLERILDAAEQGTITKLSSWLHPHDDSCTIISIGIGNITIKDYVPYYEHKWKPDIFIDDIKIADLQDYDSAITERVRKIIFAKMAEKAEQKTSVIPPTTPSLETARIIGVGSIFEISHLGDVQVIAVDNISLIATVICLHSMDRCGIEIPFSTLYRGKRIS